MKPMTIDRQEYPIWRCRQGDKTWLMLGGRGGIEVARGRSRGELLGDFRRRQLENEEP